MKTLLTLVLSTPIPVAVPGDCRCHRPERDAATRWGGNDSVVVTPNAHFRKLRGVVEAFVGETMEDALVEVFNQPDYFVPRVYIVVDRKAVSNKPLHVGMHLGT